MMGVRQNKVDWSVFQQDVFQNQSTELNLRSNGKVIAIRNYLGISNKVPPYLTSM